jgi:mannose-6-phosphate isomerase class I
LIQTAQRPFRSVPYFDPGVWGGQWMKEVCNLDKDSTNFAWSFDGVPEENSLYLHTNAVTVEVPAMNLVLYQPKNLLGQKVYARFGAEFPIRFDFLDTMEGQNLSLQVHPLTDYIHNEFGMQYTQDESYYILDAVPGAHVYLGIKDGIDPEDMLRDLKAAQNESINFDAEAYVNQFPAKKHDHFLIPAGTVHCSGAGCMVLEISATPYIFTFKLWDWGRLGMDGRPRPIHIEHGEKVIQWDRRTDWVKDNLVSPIYTVNETRDSIEEHTGLHELEFIETRRFWITGICDMDTQGTLNMLNLIEGTEAVIESPDHQFEPFTVHYAETFIIPAAVGRYTIRGTGKDDKIGVIKAYVRD